jgi:DNA-binding response OmpR family regulator
MFSFRHRLFPATRPAPRAAPDRRDILVVEDDPAVAQVIYRILELRGYRARLADSIERARAELTYPPACVILDLGLPDGDGAPLITEAKAAGAGTRVLVLTGLSELAALARVESLGPDALLQKPDDLMLAVELIGRAA